MNTRNSVINTSVMRKIIALALTIALIVTFTPLNRLDVYAADAGDDAGSALAIDVNQVYTDNLSTGSDKDWFKFTIPSKGKVNVTMTFPTTDATLYYCYFYPIAGDTSSNTYYYMGKGNNAATNTYRLPAGTYYIQITDYNFVNSDYTVKVNYTDEGPNNTEIENNDTASSATDLALNTAYVGNLSTGNDKDWYKFTVPAKSKVDVSLTFPMTDTTLYYCYFYPIAGSTSSNTYYYMGKGDNASTGTHRLPAGTYYIQITDYNFVNTDYTIKVNYTDEKNSNTEVEYNDAASSATNLSLNTAYVGNLSTGNDKDWYKFTLTGDAAVRVHMTFPQTTDNLYYCYFYPTVGNTQKSDSYYMGKGNNSSTNTYRLSAGTYHIQISDYNFVNTDYTISIQTVSQVTLNANGGIVSSASHTVETGAAVGTLPKATRTGYTFASWWTAKKGGTKVTASTKVPKSVTYYAHWTAKKYKVKFNANQGKKLSASKAKKTVTYAKKYGKLPTPKRKGYKFGGWYTDKYFGIKIKAGSKVNITKTTTLYAHWIKR